MLSSPRQRHTFFLLKKFLLKIHGCLHTSWRAIILMLIHNIYWHFKKRKSAVQTKCRKLFSKKANNLFCTWKVKNLHAIFRMIAKARCITFIYTELILSATINYNRCCCFFAVARSSSKKEVSEIKHMENTKHHFRYALHKYCMRSTLVCFVITFSI